MKRGARWNRCVEQTSQKMTALSLSRFQYAKLPPGAIDGAFLGDLFYALSPHAVHVLGLSDPAAEWKCVWQVPPHRRYVPGYSREAFLKSAPPDRKPHLQFYRLYATAAHLFVLTEWEPVAPAKAVDATPGRLNSKRIFRIDGPELVPVNTPFSAPFDVRCDDADFFVRKDGVELRRRRPGGSVVRQNHFRAEQADSYRGDAVGAGESARPHGSDGHTQEQRSRSQQVNQSDPWETEAAREGRLAGLQSFEDSGRRGRRGCGFGGQNYGIRRGKERQ